MPPSLSAFTGVLSSRLEVSAALRMSWSPMLRTLLAWAANSGDRVWALVSASRNPSTRASSAGTCDGSTWGAIAGAWVVATGLGGSGAVRVSVATWSGGVRGDGAAAPAASVMSGASRSSAVAWPIYSSEGRRWVAFVAVILGRDQVRG